MEQPKEQFKTSVGGQALMEGIMMRGPEKICCAVRRPDGEIDLKMEDVKHHPWQKIPLVRGSLAMIESMVLGYRYLMHSAEVSMGEDFEQEESKFDKWVNEHCGPKAQNALFVLAALLGGGLAILLFLVLPTLITGLIGGGFPLGRWPKVILEACIKLSIFVLYLFLFQFLLVNF